MRTKYAIFFPFPYDSHTGANFIKSRWSYGKYLGCLFPALGIFYGIKRCYNKAIVCKCAAERPAPH